MSSIHASELKVSSTDAFIADVIGSEKRKSPKGTRKFYAGVTRCEIVGDFLAVFAALFLSYECYRFLSLGKHISLRLNSLAGAGLVLATAVVLLLERSGAYHPGNSLLRVRETERVLKASIQASCLAFVLSYFTNYFWPRWLIAIVVLAIPLFLIVEKNLAYNIVRWLHTMGYGVQRVVIYGAGLTGRRIFSALARSPKLGLIPVAFVDDDLSLQGQTVYESSYHRRRSASVLSGPLTQDLIETLNADRVLIGIPSVSKNKFLKIAGEANAAGAAVSFVPYHLGPSVAWIDYADVDGLLLATFGAPEELERYELLKRAFDLGVGTAIMILIAPVLVGISIWIRLTSAGPAFFVQERVGKHGKRFNMFKFRTMYIDAPKYDYSPITGSDPRITTIGRFLRRSSLDELPQIFNVLKGDMSLVGPRPEMPFIVQEYGPLHRQRLEVKPGITGLWQLSADRKYLIHENIEYDLYYIRNRSFFMDLAILLHTLVFAARGI